MKILFRREQYQPGIGPIKFRLWAKLEPDEEETHLINTYNFRTAILYGELQEGLIKQCIWIGAAVWIIAGLLLFYFFGQDFWSAPIMGLLIAIGVGYWWFTERREIIFVRDLLHGRTFRCRSVIGLAQKEAKLDNAAYLLRQVVESAKTWDGTETNPIDALPKDEAKQLILQAFPDVA